MTAACPFCDGDGGVLLWRGDALRVVLADEPDYPGFCRVIWNAHVAEFTDLDVPSRSLTMRTVAVVEQVLRGVMRPDKINLASLGNQVPHLHWHVIPRFRDDPHFPAPVWAARQRDVAPSLAAERRAQAETLRVAVAAALNGNGG